MQILDNIEQSIEIHTEVSQERKLTEDEIIEGLRKALQYYADPNRQRGLDLCRDDCSGLYLQEGQVARNALNYYNKNTHVYVQ